MSESNQIFFALDFDRTLFNTDVYSRYYLDAVAKLNKTISDQLEPLLSASDVSFRSLIEQGRGQEFTRNVESMVAEVVKGDELLMPGAGKLLSVLRKNSIDFGIVTFGDLDTQSHKVVVSGLDGIPYYVVSNVAKGTLIAEWQGSDGLFYLPPELKGSSLGYKEIVLIDDRSRSFEGLPKGAVGYHLSENKNEALPNHQGKVIGVTSLNEVVDIITR